MAQAGAGRDREYFVMLCEDISKYSVAETPYPFRRSRQFIVTLGNLEVRMERSQRNLIEPGTCNYLISEGSTIMKVLHTSDRLATDLHVYARARARHNADHELYPIPLDEGRWLTDTEVIVTDNGEYFFLRFENTRNRQRILKIWPTSHEQLHKIAVFACD